MANLPQEFRDKIDRLERNFAVSTVIFKKYRPIFLDIFRNPADCPVRPPRGRKQRLVAWNNVIVIDVVLCHLRVNNDILEWERTAYKNFLSHRATAPRFTIGHF